MKVDSILWIFTVSSRSFETAEPVHLGDAEVVCSQSELQIYAEFLQVASK